MHESICSLHLTRTKNGKLKNRFTKTQSEFDNPYDFADQVAQARLEHYQLAPGNYYGELTQIISDPVIISTHSMNLSILQIGPGADGYTTFLFPGNLLQDVSWRKYRLTGKRIGILKSGEMHFGVTPPNFFATPLSLSNSYLNDLIIKHGYEGNIYKLIQQTEAIDLKAEDAFQIQQMAITLCSSRNLDYDLMTITLPELILKSIANIAGELPKQQTASREIAFSNSLAYIHRHLDQEITTSNICSVVEISERNLRYIFKDIIGLSPMKYVKFVKLNKVRKDIRNAKKNIDIGTIAGKWGFSHAGRFAAAYKKLFGEYPNESRKI